jgi:hypothetical protein
VDAFLEWAIPGGFADAGRGKGPAPHATRGHGVAITDDHGVGAQPLRGRERGVGGDLAGHRQAQRLGSRDTDRLPAPVAGGIQRAFHLATGFEGAGGGTAGEHDQ